MESDKPSKSSVKKAAKRRLLIAAVAIGAGLLCEYLPAEAVMPCRAVAKVLALFGG